MPRVELPQDGLFDFLRFYAPVVADLVPSEIARVLKPYYQMTGAKGYPLKPEEGLNIFTIGDAIRATLRMGPLPQIAFCSAASLKESEKPAWMAKSVYEEGLGTSSWIGLEASVEKNLWHNLDTQVEEALGNVRSTNLFGMIGEALDGVHDCIEGIFADGTAYSDDVWLSFLTSLHLYVGLCFMNEYRAKLMAKVLAVQTRCIILGPLVDDPNTWVVLCA